MTTPYIDPQIVFASDAPTQDKPPALNNYVKGMDETRSNEGRPTIKQFNFIQQQNDFKFLYIHERGACLPFVEGFPYENNAIVFKDGLIQQKNGASWFIPFMRASQNLAELTDVAQARTKLDVYSKSETLGKANNLSDLADKPVARANLGVYSKTHIDSELLKKANVTGEFTYFSALMNTLYVNNNDFDITIYAGFKLPTNSNVNVQINANVVGFCTNYNYNTSNPVNFQTITFRVPSKATYKFNTVAGNPSVELIGWQP